MSADDNGDDKSGYGKPPKRTRWNEGQSGNPKRRYRKRTPSAAEAIDKLLLKLVEVTIRGKQRKITTFEAILRQLWQKEVAGDTRALKIRMKFQEFARQFSKPRIEIVFVDNEYTAAFAAIPLDEGEDDE